MCCHVSSEAKVLAVKSGISIHPARLPCQPALFVPLLCWSGFFCKLISFRYLWISLKLARATSVYPFTFLAKCHVADWPFGQLSFGRLTYLLDIWMSLKLAHATSVYPFTFLAKCHLAFGQLSFLADWPLANCHFGQIYVWPFGIFGRFTFGQLLFGRLTFGQLLLASFISIKIWPSNCNFRWQRAQIQDKMGRFTFAPFFAFWMKRPIFRVLQILFQSFVFQLEPIRNKFCSPNRYYKAFLK